MLRSNDWLPARFVFALPEGHRGLVVEDAAIFRIAFERSLSLLRDIAEMAQQRAAVPFLDLGAQSEMLAATYRRDEIGGVKW